MNEKHYKVDLRMMEDSRWLVAPPQMGSRYLDLFVQEVGGFHMTRGHYAEREGLESFQIYFLCEGESTLVYRGKQVRMAAGDVFWINCRDAYHTCVESDEATDLWVHFDGGFAAAYQERFYQLNHESAVMRCQDPAELRQKLNALIALLGAGGVTMPIRAAELVYRLMAQLLCEASGETLGETPGQDAIRRTVEYLEANYAQQIFLEDAAQCAGLNRYYLTRLFQERVGVTPREYLLRLRIQKAKELLRQSACPVQEVAQRTGFESANYFIRVFRRCEGMTPNQFRKSWK
ncbi:MAG: AraC family transcriptional regulator [Eubacteriales bacterium]|nr:AraC family transcriptional regulator [Eubacteriales bacterium]